VRILQIRQAEVAFADGRLDEACGLLADAELRSHRRGQTLVGRVVAALVERAAAHLEADRCSEALADLDKAEGLGGNQPTIARLREQVQRAVHQRQSSQRRRADVVSAARRHMQNGRLSLADQVLAEMNGDSRAEPLRREAAGRRAAGEAAVARARAATERGDWAAAIDAVGAAETNEGPTDRVSALRADVIGATARRIGEDVRRGRLDLAETLLAKLRPIVAGSTQVAELSRVIAECRRAWGYVQRGDVQRACEVLQLVQTMLPEATWLAEAVAHAGRAAEAHGALRSGPLAMLSHTGDEPTGRTTLPMSAADPARQGIEAPASARPAGPTPLRMLLHVDGAGSFVVMRSARVTVGPVSSPARPDVGLMADANVPVVTIERADGDYFLRAAAPVVVNDRPTAGKLLADGDRVALSPRCRFRFRLPNAASTTAVLELSGGRLAGGDARRVILLDREMILGAAASAHVRAAGLASQAVLFLRDGQLRCRTDLAVTADRRPMPGDAPVVPVGTPIHVGSVGLVLKGA